MDFWLDEKGLFDSGGQLNDLARKKKGWDPLRRATILSSWRKAKLDFGFDKMMNLSLSLIYSTWSIPSLICPTPLEPKNYHSNLTTWATHGDWFSSIASDSFMTLTVVN